MPMKSEQQLAREALKLQQQQQRRAAIGSSLGGTIGTLAAGLIPGLQPLMPLAATAGSALGGMTARAMDDSDDELDKIVEQMMARRGM